MLLNLKNIFFILYQKISKSLYGSGLSKIPIIRNSHRKLIKDLKPDFIHVFDYKMYLDPNDQGGYSIQQDSETEELRFLKEKFGSNSGKTIVDIGANIGFYTLFFAKLVGPKGMVYAFEPEPKNFEILKKNISVNDLKNVKCYNFAVGSSNRTVNMSLSDEMGHHQIDLHGDLEVKCIKLDDYIKNADFIKIDAEGSEEQILKGMPNLLQQNISLMIEYYYKLLKKQSNPISVIQILLKNNFSFLDMRNNFKLTTLDEIQDIYTESSGATDLFCYKS